MSRTDVLMELLRTDWGCPYIDNFNVKSNAYDSACASLFKLWLQSINKEEMDSIKTVSKYIKLCFFGKVVEGSAHTFPNTCLVSIMKKNLMSGDARSLYCVFCVEHVLPKSKISKTLTFSKSAPKETLRLYMLGFIWDKNVALLFGREVDGTEGLTVNGLQLLEPQVIFNCSYLSLDVKKVASINYGLFGAYESDSDDTISYQPTTDEDKANHGSVYVFHWDPPRREDAELVDYLMKNPINDITFERLNVLCSIMGDATGSYQLRKLPLDGIDSYNRDRVAINVLCMICCKDERLTKWYIRAEQTALGHNIASMDSEEKMALFTENNIKFNRRLIDNSWYRVDEYLSDVLEVRLDAYMKCLNEAIDIDSLGIYSELMLKCLEYIADKVVLPNNNKE
jgi:hypothetical protein